MADLTEAAAPYLLGDDVIATLQNPTPTSEPSETLADWVLAQGLLQLSTEDREKVYHDVHGLSDEIEESAEFVDENLAKLGEELSKIRNKEAYNAAKAIDQAYVEKRDFRLQFLRAESFDAKKAALRIARHFQAKSDLFGRDKIARDILQSDLEKEDLECLYAGYEQFLPARDCAGRVVFIQVAHPNHKRMSEQSKLRRFYYQMYQLFRDDVETQTKGIVAVIYMMGEMCLSGYTMGERFKYPKLIHSLPISFAAVHVCYDSKIWRAMIHVTMLVIDEQTRLRCREYCGSHQEIMYKLMTFGLPVSVMPLQGNGEDVTTEFHKKYFETLKKQEQDKEMTNNARIPGPNDVLFGRGTATYQHFGNMRLKKMIEDLKDTYDGMTREERDRKSVV